MSERTEEELAQAAGQGDRAALEELVAHIQTRLYNLAVRMLWHPEDAEDATQEILLKIVTHLGTFRGESLFSTWCWRIATNHLLTTRKRRAEQQALSLTQFAADLDQGLGDDAFTVPDDVDRRLLEEEVKVGCMQGMLLCLTREERATYIVGEFFEVTDKEGAEIFAISPDAYRKRLSRVRQTIRTFMTRTCGLVTSTNPCRCSRQVQTAIANGRLDPTHLLFASSGADSLVARGIAQMDSLNRIGGLFRSHPMYQAPGTLLQAVRDLLESGRVSFLN